MQGPIAPPGQAGDGPGGAGGGGGGGGGGAGGGIGPAPVIEMFEKVTEVSLSEQ
jgi:hypothetical protein